MLSGIRDFLIITNKEHINIFQSLLGNEEDFGFSFNYAMQNKPEGIAPATLLASEFIGDNSISMALGDNLFHGNDLISLLNSASLRRDGQQCLLIQLVIQKNMA